MISHFHSTRHNVIKELLAMEGAAAAGDALVKMERIYGCVCACLYSHVSC